MKPSLSRTTRSGRTFASWDGPAIIPNRDFDLVSLIQRAVDLEQESQPPDDLFPDMDPRPSDYGTALMADVDDDGDGWVLDDNEGNIGADSPSSTCTPPSTRPPFSSSTCAPSSSTSAPSSFSRPKLPRRHSPVPSLPSLPISASRKHRAKLQSRRNRQKQREAEKAKLNKFGGPIPRLKATEKYARMAEPVATINSAKRARHAETGYTGLPDPKKEQARRTHGLEELTGEGYEFEVRQWDGKTPFPIIDRTGTIIGVAIGHPEDDGWERLHQHAAECLEHARQCCNPVLSEDDMRRGRFWTCRCGVSHGGGQTEPKNFSNTKATEKMLEFLNSQPCFQRLAAFTSTSFASWAPSLHNHYCEELGKLQDHDPSLRRAFDSSVFMATTYNLGPQTVCFRHLDSGNLAFGWCAITALGSFDPTKGGHLVLWECKLIIEFPPGSTILIPSALIHHSNTPIAKGETRYSFTQYAAGGLFRWVDHDFQTATAYRAPLSKEALAELDERHSRRWCMGLAKLPRMDWVPGPDI